MICRFQGDDTLDPDLPTYFEAWLFQSRIGKVFYIIAQPLLYAVRPLLRVPKPYTLLEVANNLLFSRMEIISLSTFRYNTRIRTSSYFWTFYFW